MKRGSLVCILLISLALLAPSVLAATPVAPTWIEPSEGKTDVDPHSFKLHVIDFSDPDGDVHVATDFEIYDVDSGELVWEAPFETLAKNRIESGDGTFINSLASEDQLLTETEYRTRARYYSSGNSDTQGPWSEWRYFTTRPELVFEDSPFEWTAREGFTVELVAEDINLPTDLVAAPDIYGHLPESDQPLLYFTQLYDGIGVLLRDGTYVEYVDDLLNFDDLGGLPGAGELGITGLYVDPSTGDLYVSRIYEDIDVRADGFLGLVEKFTTNSAGTGFTSREIIIDEIPSAPAHQVHKITRGPDGKLYLNTGDNDIAGDSKDISKLSGKILRFNDDGSMPSDNPHPGTYVWASGFRNPFGAAWRPGTSELYVTNNGADEDDGLYKVEAGDEFGWCCSTADDTWHLWPKTVAPVALVFDEGDSDFPEDSEGTMYVALSGKTYAEGQSEIGKRIVQFRVREDGTRESLGELVTYTGDGYGTPLGLAFTGDGLYFTDIYGDAGFTGFGETKGRIYRVVQGEQMPGDDAGSGEFSAGIGTAPWYPQGLDVIWECKAINGVGPFTYDFYYGDGQETVGTPNDNVYHTYPSEGVYDVFCVVYDSATGLSAVAQTQLVLGDVDVPPGDTCTPIPEVCDGEDNDCDDAVDEDGVCDGVCVPSTEVCDGIDNDCDDQVDENDVCSSDDDDGGDEDCFYSVSDVPVSCDGDITLDLVVGCRHVTCEQGANSLTVLACNKPGNHDAQHFEMYKQTTEGEGVEICLGDTCLDPGITGFVQSEAFPHCMDDLGDAGDSCTPSEEVCDGLDNDCDELVDEEDVCGACVPSEEVCDGVDNDCDLVIDEDDVCSSDDDDSDDSTRNGLIALYMLNEGTGSIVYDSSGYGDPLNLVLDGLDVNWVEDGVVFDGSSAGILSTDTPTKIIDAVKASNQLSVEVWVRPEFVEQVGPARIVSIADGPQGSRINTHLGQNGNEASWRVRATKDDGYESYQPSQIFPGSELYHIVATYNGVDMRLFKNGVEVGSGNNVLGVLDFWSDDYLLALGNEVTLDRQWEGELYMAAFYDIALSPEDVAENFAAGSEADGIGDDIDLGDTGDDPGDELGDDPSDDSGDDSGISTTLQIKPSFPQGLSVVFECVTSGFAPIRYDWFFGDGDLLVDVPNDDTWHTYDASGSYEVTCIASSLTESKSDTLVLEI